MAHAFTIINSSDETVVYTDYDAIDLTALKHVIGFIPDIGTLVESNEILLESGVFSDEQNFITEGSLSTIEVELETGTGSGGLLVETGDDVRLEDITFIGERTLVAGDNLVLDGTDSSSTNAGDNLIQKTFKMEKKIILFLKQQVIQIYLTIIMNQLVILIVKQRQKQDTQMKSIENSHYGRINLIY
jgi:hypothetical protein